MVNEAYEPLNRFWAHPAKPRWVNHPLAKRMLSVFDFRAMNASLTRTPKTIPEAARRFLPIVWRTYFPIRYAVVCAIPVTYGFYRMQAKNDEDFARTCKGGANAYNRFFMLAFDDGQKKIKRDRKMEETWKKMELYRAQKEAEKAAKDAKA